MCPLRYEDISECFSHVYLGREANIMDDSAPELIRKKRAEWGATRNIEGLMKKRKSIRHLAPLINIEVFPAWTCASETWTLRERDIHAVSAHSVLHRETMLGISLYTHARAEGKLDRHSVNERRSEMPLSRQETEDQVGCTRSRYRDDRWTRAVTDWIPRDIERTSGRPRARW
uniref:Transposase n=1 Tax=Haemonchus contortus TaxID=6289 RepID=A0A7I4YSI5_HAECO